MPIRPFLSGQAFDPETIQKMDVALKRVCNALGLKMVDDPATRLIAQKVIEQAQRGVGDVSKLTALTLGEFQKVEGGAWSCDDYDDLADRAEKCARQAPPAPSRVSSEHGNPSGRHSFP